MTDDRPLLLVFVVNSGSKVKTKVKVRAKPQCVETNCKHVMGSAMVKYLQTWDIVDILKKATYEDNKTLNIQLVGLIEYGS